MGSKNKIYSFFIFLSMLFWNPLSYYLFYHKTSVYPEKATHLFYWLVFISGILLIFLINKSRLGRTVKNIAFSMAFMGIIFSLVVIIDGVIGLLVKSKVFSGQEKQGLIFEPGSKAIYHTVEFDCVAEINSLGLRDREFNIEKGDAYRILCFGDSWTFGWGVNLEDCWPKKLERYLQAKGYDHIEVINCGQGDQYTSTYKKYMEKAVPLLKPDLVLVGVLQLDDLAQIYENNSQTAQDIDESGHNITYVIKKYLKYSLDNILVLLKNKKSKTVEIKPGWKKSSASLINHFDFLQALRFKTLDDSVQRLFKSGDLNPGLLNYYINFPDRVTIFNNPNNQATVFSMQEMTRDLKEMKDICEKHHAGLIFINMPTNYFTGHQVIRTPSDVLNPYFETNNHIDSIYRSVASVNSVPYIELTDYFRQLENKSDYFYLYDGHPNKKGYEEIAGYIGNHLIEQHKLLN